MHQLQNSYSVCLPKNGLEIDKVIAIKIKRGTVFCPLGIMNSRLFTANLFVDENVAHADAKHCRLLPMPCDELL